MLVLLTFVTITILGIGSLAWSDCSLRICIFCQRWFRIPLLWTHALCPTEKNIEDICWPSISMAASHLQSLRGTRDRPKSRESQAHWQDWNCTWILAISSSFTDLALYKILKWHLSKAPLAKVIKTNLHCLTSLQICPSQDLFVFFSDLILANSFLKIHKAASKTMKNHSVNC